MNIQRYAVGLSLLSSVLLACSDSTGPAPPCSDAGPLGDGPNDCAPGNNDFDFPMHHSDPAWSSKGRICFEDQGVVWVHSSGLYQTDPALAGLWVLDPMDLEKQRIVPFGRAPAWSPDGSRIAFSTGQIFTVDADGTGLTQLTFDGRNHFPSWSPSGEWIAYDDEWHVWVMRADGSDARNMSFRQELCMTI